MKAPRFQYHAASSIDEIVSLLASESHGHPGSSTVLIAGGQTLVPALNLRRLQPNLVVDITHVSALSAVDHTGNRLVFGACISARMIEDGLAADSTRGILSGIAACTGSRAVRCRATVGGNLSVGDPVSDWIVGLSVLNASVTAISARGSRSVAVSEIGQQRPNAIARDELLVSVSVPDISAGSAWGTWSLRRTAGARPEISAAIFAERNSGSIRCAIGIPGRTLAFLEYPNPPAAFRKTIGSGLVPSINDSLSLLDEVQPHGSDNPTKLMAAALGRAAALAIWI